MPVFFAIGRKATVQRKRTRNQRFFKDACNENSSTVFKPKRWFLNGKTRVDAAMSKDVVWELCGFEDTI